MQIQPYLFFDGRCDEAIEFYTRALGAKNARIMRFRDGPPGEHGQAPPGAQDKVMHASFWIGDTELMASDGHCRGQPTFKGFSLSIAAQNDAEAGRLFASLAEGGEVQMPLGKTFFASSFGIVSDRFGISWMVIAGA
jgi:PhnB protein